MLKLIEHGASPKAGTAIATFRTKPQPNDRIPTWSGLSTESSDRRHRGPSAFALPYSKSLKNLEDRKRHRNQRYFNETSVENYLNKEPRSCSYPHILHKNISTLVFYLQDSLSHFLVFLTCLPQT